MVNISFEEAAKGCRKEISYPKVSTCAECGGSGRQKGDFGQNLPELQRFRSGAHQPADPLRRNADLPHLRPLRRLGQGD